MTGRETSAQSAGAVATGEEPAILARAGEQLLRQLRTPLAPGLHIVATPIGNLADITLRAIAVLARADLILAEDTRHSRTLLTHFGIERQLRAYHDHSSDADRDRVLADLMAGRRVALISDAGTPLVSDPGFRLARAAIDAGIPVHAIPGPSAVLTALAASGLATDAFLFAGFLPPRQAARRTRLAELARVPATLVLFESPARLAASLGDLSAILGDRPAVVARELTKLYEELRRGTLAELAAGADAITARGEVTLVIAPAAAAPMADDDAIRAALAVALGTSTLRDAVDAVAAALDVPRRRVYRLALALAEGGSSGPEK